MNKKTIGIGVVGLALLAAGTGVVLGDGWEREHEREGHRSGWFGWRDNPDVRPVRNEQYDSECGACHFAYQPALLPARSWESMMGNLADHFGENAELDDAAREALTRYLVENAADRDGYGRAAGFAASVAPGNAPLRITETRYFVRKHDEVPSRFVQGNPEVRSFSNCTACHRGAADGNFNEHAVRIPGVGRWED